MLHGRFDRVNYLAHTLIAFISCKVDGPGWAITTEVIASNDAVRIMTAAP